MVTHTKKLITLLVVAMCLYLYAGVALASPYGAGLYNENVPYGSATSISLTTSGTVALLATPGGATVTNTDTVTVTTSDVDGYILNLKDNDTNLNLVKVGDTIVPTSGTFAVPAAIDSDSWGYRISTFAPDTYAGITSSAGAGDNIRTRTGPYTSGDQTIVTYAVKVSATKTSGLYTDTVLYTATGQTP